MDKRIFYLGYYDIVDNKEENRNICLAATNKMAYIITALEKADYGVDVISSSATRNPQGYNGKTIKIGKKSTLTLFKTLPWGNKIRRVLSTLYSKNQLKKYINENIGENDTLMVYHSVAYAKMLCALKKKKKFKLVLEVEEIYADVNQREEDREKEYKIFETADAYVFSTELLNEKINTRKKPYCVSYGTYQVEEERNCKFDDGKIHVIYAGTFDPRKGGLQATLSAVPFLNSNYHVHILTSCNKEERQWLINEVERLSQNCQCKLTYDGYLSGEQYIRFLQSCHIGLSTQTPQGEYNDTSFPSKVLTYLANGLRVVSIRIPVVEKAAISPMIHFYSENNGEEIAKAIMSVDINKPYNSREKIRELDVKFTSEMKKMLENMQ